MLIVTLLLLLLY